METIATGLQELSLDNEELPLSVHTVVSNDDLLNEILLRLPVISLVLFKSVSKRWLSLIKDATFIKRRSQIPNIDPPSGLFLHFRFNRKVVKRVSVPFDIRIPLRDEKIFKTVPRSSTTFLQSCNGLFLCSVRRGKFCVYNPTVNLFKVLPKPLYYEPKLDNLTSMYFDPTKSPHYKVVHATPIGRYNFRIQTYSSETSIWNIVCSCSNRLPYSEYFRYGIYFNDAIHWINRANYKLEFVNETAVLTKIQLPVTMDTMDNYPKLFQSRGCLLLLGKNKTQSDQLNVYEMVNGDSEWSLKYSVNHSRISSYVWCIQGVLCIALGEREEDSFMVIKLDEKVFLYKFSGKTFCELPQLESMLSKRIFFYSTGNFLFTASFASV